MINLFKEIDFSKEIQQNPDLKVFIMQACKKLEQEESDPLRRIKKPELDDELLNQFIISGIPVLNKDNQDKFLTLFKTKLLQAKKIGEKNGLLNIEVGKTEGLGNQTLYLTYKSTTEAKNAFIKLNNFKFDKNHTLQCYSVNEVRTIIEEEEKNIDNRPFQSPVLAKTKEKLEHNLDEQRRSQFIIREGSLVYLNWLDHLDKSSKNALATQFHSFEFPINKAIFSTRGSYLALCTSNGTYIYYGPKFSLKGILPQTNSTDAKFSQDERYIITSNGNLSKNRENFIIWDLQTQIKIKSFKGHTNQSLESFQFSENCQNLAIVLLNEVAVYNISNIEQFKRQLKLSEEEQNIVKAPHVQKISWIKGNTWVIIMCYEIDYNPVNVSATKIFLYNIETRQQKKWRAWSEHARNGQIFVSQRGDWVAISLKKFIKKNHFATAIQIANLVRKEDPLEISCLQIKDEVVHINWDWHNNRFGVMSEDQSTKRGINVRFVASFYELAFKNKSLQINKIGQIKDNLQNKIYLSSNGSFFTFYNITEESPQKGKFSFGLISRQTKEKDKGKRICNFEFTKQNLVVNGMNFFHVDDSGRFILLGTDKGYQVWNFIGQIITKDTLQKSISDVHWRPRYINQLPEEQQKALLDNQKQIRKRYEEMDDRRINALKYEKEAARHLQKETFLDFIKQKRDWFKQFNGLRQKAMGFREQDVRSDKYIISEGIIDIQ